MSQNEVGKVYVRPWGSYQTLRMEKNHQVKVLIIHPGGRLSLQKHMRRSEHWTVVRGTPTLTIHQTTKVYKVDESVYIPCGAVHRIENFGNEDCQIIEVQVGDYLGEDDIIRLEDIYERK